MAAVKKATLDLVLTEVQKLGGAITRLSSKVSNLDDKFTNLDSKVTSLENRIDQVDKKNDARFEYIKEQFHVAQATNEERFDRIDRSLNTLADQTLRNVYDIDGLKKRVTKLENPPNS